MRSYSGCLTCKRRKLKCDESKPECGNCKKASRDCSYGNRSIFRRQDISSSDKKRKYRGSRKAKQRPKPRDDLTWVEVPSDLTFVEIEDPTNTESARPSQTDQQVSNGELRDPEDIAESPRADDIISPRITPARAAHTPIETPSVQLSLLDDHSFLSPHPRRDIAASENVLVCHLLRHFKQGPGQWMDLFDTTAYFSSKVPVLAASKPVLRSAVCALSAKHMRHVSKVTIHDNETPVPNLSNGTVHWANEEAWEYQSAMHYDQALSGLKSMISMESYLDNFTEKEEMLAAVAILCAFELMDAPGSAWRAHLSALPLFHDEPSSLANHPSIVIPQTAVKGPIFWSLARQDLLCAFISESQTRLNLKDMRLWQNAGLATDLNGDILPYSPFDVIESQNTLGFEEDKKSNELTWILGKIANHLTAGDALAAEDNSLPPDQRSSIGLTQQHLLEIWNLLMADLERWHDSLPPTFIPTARTKCFGPITPGYESSFNTFEQIWFDLPIAAATIQSYHQAKILLLANEPQESTALRSTVSARLRSYRHALGEVIYHAREICGISLANSTDPFRVNSVQALFVAGQVFQEKCEQDAVLEILSGIERDIGWTTRFHIAKLKDEWEKGREGNHVERGERRSEFGWSI